MPLSPNRNHFSKKRSTIETQIASQNRGSSLLFETKGSDIYPCRSHLEGGAHETPDFTSLSGYDGSDGGVRRHCSSGLHEKSPAADTRIRSRSRVRATGKRRISFKNTFNKS